MCHTVQDLIILESPVCLPCEVKNALYKKIISVAMFFGFAYLPEELRIHLHICEKNDFDKAKRQTEFYEIEEVIAFTWNINHVYILNHECMKKHFSAERYIEIIVHECIHVLQFYFTRLPQRRYAWLYESVACYLAGQEKAYDNQNQNSWDDFKTDFYHIDNCYGLAYKFGRSLFETHPDELLRIIRFPESNEDVLAEIYNSL